MGTGADFGSSSGWDSNKPSGVAPVAEDDWDNDSGLSAILAGTKAC